MGTKSNYIDIIHGEIYPQVGGNIPFHHIKFNFKKRKLYSIMLIGGGSEENFIHERAIKKSDLKFTVISESWAEDALKYLTANEEPRPELILLDVNMPGINGWEFLQQYNQRDKEIHDNAIIIILTASDNPRDLATSKTCDIVSDYIRKPLTQQMVDDITAKYFNNM